VGRRPADLLFVRMRRSWLYIRPNRANLPYRSAILRDDGHGKTVQGRCRRPSTSSPPSRLPRCMSALDRNRPAALEPSSRPSHSLTTRSPQPLDALRHRGHPGGAAQVRPIRLRRVQHRLGRGAGGRHRHRRGRRSRVHRRAHPPEGGNRAEARPQHAHHAGDGAQQQDVRQPDGRRPGDEREARRTVVLARPGRNRGCCPRGRNRTCSSVPARLHSVVPSTPSVA